jgi:hypothetical protein
MTDYMNITITDGTNSKPIKVPKNASLEGVRGDNRVLKEGSILKMTKAQYKTALALSNLDGQKDDLDGDDLAKFAKMSKSQQISFVNNALGSNSKFKVGKYYSGITEETFGITARNNLLSIPITEGGKTEEDPPNAFVMSF